MISEGPEAITVEKRKIKDNIVLKGIITFQLFIFSIFAVNFFIKGDSLVIFSLSIFFVRRQLDRQMIIYIGWALYFFGQIEVVFEVFLLKSAQYWLDLGPFVRCSFFLKGRIRGRGAREKTSE